MDTAILAESARAITAERVEMELERLRAARPWLESRIDRAASILVMQLSSPAHQRPIRVRVGASGRRFLVASSRGGAVYEVDPRGWSCSCPDAHRHCKGCKHALACYVLQRVATRKGCRVCNDGWVSMGVETEDRETEEVLHACRRCAEERVISPAGDPFTVAFGIGG